jgi:hypothetical protein
MRLNYNSIQYMWLYPCKICPHHYSLLPDLLSYFRVRPLASRCRLGLVQPDICIPEGSPRLWDLSSNEDPFEWLKLQGLMVEYQSARHLVVPPQLR